MIDIKKTIRHTTFIFISCIFIIVLFIMAPFIEDMTYDRVFVVTFDNGVSDNIEVLVQEGTTVLKPEEPKKDGYKFTGWYYKNEEYDFSTYVTKDIILKAIWEKEEKTTNEEVLDNVVENNYIVVEFDVKGGSLIDSQRIKKGETASIPNNPTKESYTFVEWQVNGKSYDFGTLLEEDTTIVAIWKEN